MVTDGKASRWDQIQYLAKDERLMHSGLLMPSGVTPFGTRSGIRVNGAGLTLSVSGTSPEVVTVGAGTCVVASDATGPYLVEIPSTVAVNLPARPSSGLSRIIVVIVRVYDQDDGAGPGREVKVETVLGTPSASPAAPAIPALALEVGRLLMPSSGTISVTKSTVRTVAAGGVLPVATTSERDAISGQYPGMVVFNEQTGLLERCVSAGSWKALQDAVTKPAWIPITAFAAGFAPNGFGYAPAYRVWPDGAVDWRGNVAGPITASGVTTMFTAPSTARPAALVELTVATNSTSGGATARAEFDPATGSVGALGAGTARSWASLDGLTYDKS